MRRRICCPGIIEYSYTGGISAWVSSFYRAFTDGDSGSQTGQRICGGLCDFCLRLIGEHLPGTVLAMCDLYKKAQVNKNRHIDIILTIRYSILEDAGNVL